MNFFLSESEKSTLLKTARESIQSKLSGNPPRFDQPTPKLMQPCGAFVTIHRGDRLRGCIGHILAHSPLFEAVKELSRSSAFHDPRFPPLILDELPEIDIEISVLTPLVSINSPEEVEVGVHGVYIELEDRSGVLLPQVPLEQGWNREEFLHHLCLKAGLHDGCISDPRARLSVFKAIIFGEKEQPET